MGDIICVRCGEPWDAFGITYAKGEGDMSPEEIKNFLEGRGCPSCGFGKICPRCHGGCIEKNDCPTCFGSGYVFAKRCPSASDLRFRKWFIGYSNSPQYPLRFFDEVEILHEEKPEESCDGIMHVAKVKCPDCHGKGEPCLECGGDGKLHPENQPDFLDQAIGSLLDNSDAEPVGVLMRFMRGAQTQSESAKEKTAR